MNRLGNNGITLVALIITIIIMLILVGTSLFISINSGLFDKTRAASKAHQKATEEETNYINQNFSDFLNGTRDSSFKSNIINDFEPSVSFNNGSYVEVTSNATTTNISSIESYIYLLNGEIYVASKESVILITDLNLNTEYLITIIAVNENGQMKQSSDLKITTANTTYLYKNGNECSPVTGGWKAVKYAGDGKLTKNEDSMKYTCSSGGSRYVSFASCNLINIPQYDTLNIDYTTTAPTVKVFGIATLQTYNGSNTTGHVKSVQLTNSTQQETTILDISSDSGNYYIQTYFNGDYGAVSCTVYNIWLGKN